MNPYAGGSRELRPAALFQYFKFYYRAPNPPTINYPTNNTQLNKLSFNVTVQAGMYWGGNADFHVQIDDSPDFINPEFDNNSLWSFDTRIPVSLPHFGKYYLRSRQGNQRNASDWTQTIEFEVLNIPDATPSSGPVPTATLVTLPTEIVLPPPPPIPLCFDYNFIESSVLRTSIPDEFRQQLNCRVIVKDSRLNNGEWLYPLYNYGNVGNQSLIDMGIIQGVDVYSPTNLREFHDAVICLKGTGRIFLLKDTFSTMGRTPEEAVTWVTDAFPDFTCVTLYSPATVVLVKSITVATTDSSYPNDCLVTAKYTVRIRALPTTDSEEIGKLNYQSKAQSLDYRDGWYQIDVNKIIGWIWKDYLSTSESCPK